MADLEQERRYCLERAWATVGQSGEHVRRVPEVGPVREDSMRAVLWRLMVGSHAK